MKATNLVLLLALLHAKQSWAWGSYGHQQINRAAVKFLSRVPIGSCFSKNLVFLQRASITPDYEWKRVGKKPPTLALNQRRAINDSFEHPLHYFEVDAFVPPPVTVLAINGLPSSEFAVAFDPSKGHYPDLFVKNLARVREINPEKFTESSPNKRIRNPLQPTGREVAGANGSALWRVQQLFDLAVESLVNQSYEKAFFYMGTMGHYVGDLSQPFHGTLNFDGNYYKDAAGKWRFFNPAIENSPATGIHHTFEEAILAQAFLASTTEQERKTFSEKYAGRCEDLVRKAEREIVLTESQIKKRIQSCRSRYSKRADPLTELWPKFDATEKEVLASMPLSALTPLASENLREEVLNLTASGYPYVEALLDTFADVMREFPPKIRKIKQKPSEIEDSDELPPRRSIPVSAVRKFMNASLVGSKKTVLQFAQLRMAESAMLLARIWQTVFDEAAKKGAAPWECTELAYNTLSDERHVGAYLDFAINNYPKPAYLEAPSVRSPLTLQKVRASSPERKAASD